MTPAQAYILITERPFQYAHLAPRHEGNIAARIQKAVRDEGHRPALPTFLFRSMIPPISFLLALKRRSLLR